MVSVDVKHHIYFTYYLLVIYIRGPATAGPHCVSMQARFVAGSVYE